MKNYRISLLIYDLAVHIQTREMNSGRTGIPFRQLPAIFRQALITRYSDMREDILLYIPHTGWTVTQNWRDIYNERFPTK